MALLANDACGAPIPFAMCLPWQFFDGKLFHAKLLRAESARNLMELCGGRMDIVYAVERMRGAILHGIVPQYAGPHANVMGVPMAANVSGRLMVGGTVVSQWGAPKYPKKKKKSAAQKAKAKAKKEAKEGEDKEKKDDDEKAEGEEEEDDDNESSNEGDAEEENGEEETATERSE